MTRKKKHHHTLKFWLFLFVVGFSFILWADTVCDFVKMDWSKNSITIFLVTSVIMAVAWLIYGRKVITITKGQLGG